ncbi:hypothetical protein [Limosilactobacillus reuteri]|uniref:hypothetical protein n=1 Tax=Limosilactobacillus reuteri TaxID=1598 RepID=UPI001E644438|nr:hypothetical protein [Limosilactobacillus reuteri]MCC4345087.1 hypothetical protein [Limosilactobacillus reuteri]MCC4357003.1 hypothetical protein [Limosilactobacillus reuteri]
MKIDEFIKRVNGIFYAEYSYDSNTIYIYRTEQDMIDENKGGDDTYYFMAIKLCETKFSLFIDPDWLPDNVTGLSFLFNLLRELEDTPVKERFPEKKYCLRWIDDDAGKSFLGLYRKTTGHSDPFWFLFGEPNLDAIFTESELNQLKKDNPRLATAIDAMKEEVKDNED